MVDGGSSQGMRSLNGFGTCPLWRATAYYAIAHHCHYLTTSWPSSKAAFLLGWKNLTKATP